MSQPASHLTPPGFIMSASKRIHDRLRGRRAKSPATSPDQGKAYADYLGQELATERTRQASLDDRGFKVQQSAGAVVALVSGVAALAGGKDYVLPDPAAWCLVFALVTLIVAGVFGGLATRLHDHETTSKVMFERMLNRNHWGDNQVDARYIGPFENAHTLKTLRAGNNDKSTWLRLAIYGQILGGTLVALTVALAFGYGR